MKYRVIQNFNDAQDSGYAYRVGATYPREGAAPSEQRVKELLYGNNPYHAILIQPFTEENKVVEFKKVESKVEEPVPEVEETKVEEPVEETPEEVEEEPKNKVVWTAEEISKMPYMKLKSVAKQNGIETEDMKAADIRAELIKKLVEV